MVRHRNHNPSIKEIPMTPRIKGTRIPVSLVLGYFAAGNTAEEIIDEFPDLNKDHIAACLDYARELAEFEVAA